MTRSRRIGSIPEPSHAGLTAPGAANSSDHFQLPAPAHADHHHRHDEEKRSSITDRVLQQLTLAVDAGTAMILRLPAVVLGAAASRPSRRSF